MAIVEAASCGLQVVSTRVGGIPEVLPSSLIILTEPTVESVLAGVQRAIDKVIINRNTNKTNEPPSMHQLNGVKRLHSGQNGICHSNEQSVGSKRKRRITSDVDMDHVLCPFECNRIVGHLYNWENISIRTEMVYQRVMTESDPTFGDKLNCYYAACAPFMLVVSFSYLLLKVLDYFQPREFIDITPDFTSQNK